MKRRNKNSIYNVIINYLEKRNTMLGKTISFLNCFIIIINVYVIWQLLLLLFFKQYQLTNIFYFFAIAVLEYVLAVICFVTKNTLFTMLFNMKLKYHILILILLSIFTFIGGLKVWEKRTSIIKSGLQ